MDDLKNRLLAALGWSQLTTELSKRWPRIQNSIAGGGPRNAYLAGARHENERTRALVEALVAAIDAATEELRVFHDGGTESEQTHAMLELQTRLARVTAELENLEGEK